VTSDFNVFLRLKNDPTRPADFGSLDLTILSNLASECRFFLHFWCFPFLADIHFPTLRRESNLEVVLEQLKTVEAERNALLKPATGAAASPPAMLLALKGIGPETAAVLWSEGLFRQFDNRRQVAAYAGLAPTPWQSGSIDHEQGVSKAGNPRLRTTMVELAWLWLQNQPTSALSLWFRERVRRTWWADAQDDHRRPGAQAPHRPVAVYDRRRRHRGGRDEGSAGDDLTPSART
jgi:hypothetical protein